jgi:hypothetical protein
MYQGIFSRENQEPNNLLAIDLWEVKIQHVSITNIFLEPVIWLSPLYYIPFSATYYSILHNALMLCLHYKLY